MQQLTTYRSTKPPEVNIATHALYKATRFTLFKFYRRMVSVNIAVKFWVKNSILNI